LELTLQAWDGKPALRGDYKIDTSTSIGKGGDDWGQTTSAMCIEHVVTEWDCGEVICNGFNIFRHSKVDGEGKEKKLFIANRYVSTCNNWWSDLHNTTEDDNDERFFGAKLRILGKSTALGLQADRLCDNEYFPNAQEIRIASDPDNLGVAEQLMKKYRDGSNYSWICEHLNVPSSVAFLIREYVRPPPVFYLQEDDLILEVEESELPDWNKLLVFRKEA
jgi:hypothetical protein